MFALGGSVGAEQVVAARDAGRSRMGSGTGRAPPKGAGLCRGDIPASRGSGGFVPIGSSSAWDSVTDIPRGFARNGKAPCVP